MSTKAISATRRLALDSGQVAATHLAECLAVDFAALLHAVVPGIGTDPMQRMRDAAGAGITQRMRLAAQLLREHGQDDAAAWAVHPSDTVRGWACHLIGTEPGRSLAQRIDAMRPLADDIHFGVREWAWLALRNDIADAPLEAIALLQPWTGDGSPRIRRFASEATRPRGVWATHIALFKQQPEHAGALLEALAADPERYVQDSVGNWLNDAAKTRPDWVHAVCARWALAHPGDANGYIRRRAMRSL